MQNYISFSLWGNLDKYCLGATRNARSVSKFYPGWKCIFFADDTVPIEIIDILHFSGALVDFETGADLGNKMFRRFLVNDFQDCSRYIVRDCDSRFTERESLAVRAWVKSGKAIHSMRDHPAHAREINGGLWGCTAGIIPSMRQLIDSWHPLSGEYGEDQSFLCKALWPLTRHDSLQHDSVSREHFQGSVPFPTPRAGSLRFVGEVWDIDAEGKDTPRDFDVIQIDANKD